MTTVDPPASLFSLRLSATVDAANLTNTQILVRLLLAGYVESCSGYEDTEEVC